MTPKQTNNIQTGDISHRRVKAEILPIRRKTPLNQTICKLGQDIKDQRLKKDIFKVRFSYNHKSTVVKKPPSYLQKFLSGLTKLNPEQIFIPPMFCNFGYATDSDMILVWIRYNYY